MEVEKYMEMKNISEEEEKTAVLNQFEQEISSLNKLEKIAIFIERLKNNNYNIRLYCVKQLVSVAELLGPQRTEEELIPLLLDLIINFEDNDEVLLELSNQFVSLSDYIPNKRTNVSSILKGLELLAANDDEIVRQQATDNLCSLIQTLDENTITNEIFPLMQRLIQNDIKSKVSCCYLFPVVYPTLNNDQIKKELMQAFHEISRDDSPSVRRAAAHNIKNFALIEDDELIRELVNLHSDLLRDNIDIVKVFAISSTKNLLMKLPEDEQKKLITNFNTIINKDKSWRVKYAAAETICEVCSIFDKNFNEQNFLPIVMLLLKDPEAEVRASVLAKFDNFVGYISNQKFLSNILPIFQDSLVSDHNYHVRSLFSNALVKIAKNFSPDVFEKSLFPLISKVLKDDVIEVRNSALQNFEDLACFFKNETIMLNSIFPSIHELSKDNKWRIRLTLTEKFLILAETLPQDIFISYFLTIVNNLYTDHASQIREVTYKIYEKLCIRIRDFVNSHLWSTQKFALLSTNYIMRISALNSIDYLNKQNCYEDNFLSRTVLPMAFSIKDDKVANVKFSLCNVIKSIFIQIYKKKEKNLNVNIFGENFDEAKRVLKNLSGEDQDVDVQYFAREALNEISKFSF
jgi:serine/threonine-protein phosphatase 2A regulatory subunit A